MDSTVIELSEGNLLLKKVEKDLHTVLWKLGMLERAWELCNELTEKAQLFHEEAEKYKSKYRSANKSLKDLKKQLKAFKDAKKHEEEEMKKFTMGFAYGREKQEPTS